MLWSSHNHAIVDGLSRQDFKQLLTLATTESFILFNGNYYQQIDGVAMGSPLGPTLVNVFLGFNEKKWLDDCPSQIKPNYYRRYVDDIFVLLPDVTCLEEFRSWVRNTQTSTSPQKKNPTTHCPSLTYMLDATTTNTSPPCTGNLHLAACIPITIASFQPVTSPASCQHYYIVLFSICSS